MKARDTVSPILLFVFARPEHTKRTLDALAMNVLAGESDLIVYSDAARNEKEAVFVNQVREIVLNAQGFRTVTVIERQSNYGLARNIIEGVTDICKQYGRVIVLEDDLVTSPEFLTFMNDALDHYEHEKKVWHISGWNYPIDVDQLGDAFFLRVMNCWGWATWGNRWEYFEKDTEKLVSEFDKKMIREFDLNDSGVFWSQVLLNHQNKINTWAIYWYATIFKNGGLCLNPAISYIDNIGHDGSGTHGSRSSDIYSATLNMSRTNIFPSQLIENELAIKKIISFYKDIKPTILKRVQNKIKRVFKRQ